MLGGDEANFIKDFNTKKVLGLENSATIDGTDVIIDLEDKFESKSNKWVLVPYFDVLDAEGNGWLMVKNILSERFLTAGDSKDLKIRGIYQDVRPNVLTNITAMYYKNKTFTKIDSP